jgi:N-acetylglutamate synthase-like GNAT family acetyltransferase
MAVIIRPAVAADQSAITMIVHAARISPTGLDWPRFLVAEESGGLIGVGQVKPHRDGSREVASIAVVPEWQRQGVGTAIVRGLIARESGVLHLMCLSTNAPFYERFGFGRIEREEMPPYFRRIARLAGVFELLARGDERRLTVMRREPTAM